MRRSLRLAGYAAVFAAGGLTWETLRLVSMNRADREELVAQMLDADRRAHPGDLPFRGVHLQPTPLDELETDAAREFTRCGGVKPDWTQVAIPSLVVEAMVSRRRQMEQDEQRSMMAATNGVFRLRAAGICRFWGGCAGSPPPGIHGPGRAILDWEAKVDRESYWPTGVAQAEPFALSLACGMGLRERQGLTTYPSEARLRAEEQAVASDRKRRCAQGDIRACP